MYQPQLNEIQCAKSRFEEASDLNKSFLEHVKANPISNDTHSKLEFSNGGIAVTDLGHTAEAIPRIVKAADGNFFSEYVFIVKGQETEVEVWRFYLTPSRRIAKSLDVSSSEWDFNNAYIATHICDWVLLGMLRSELLFAAYPKQSG